MTVKIPQVMLFLLEELLGKV